MIKFRQKNFSILPHVFRGAAIGGALGAGVSGLQSTATVITGGGKKKSKNRLINTANNILESSVASTGAGILIGSSLGLVAGIIDEVGNKINHKIAVDKRFLEKIVFGLKKDGFTEGIQFTRDKREANRMKTKVCLVLSTESGELNLIINTVADKKLEKLTEEVVNNIPNSSVTNRKMSDKFNEITITTIASGAEVGLLIGIIERFIHSGYQVYMVEVG